MAEKYGLSEPKWQEAIAEIRGILIKLAASRDTIFYSDLAQQIKSISIGPHDSVFHQMLGDISIDEHENGRGMLSALVVTLDTDRPGKGFFELAKELGESFSNDEAFWWREVGFVQGYWTAEQCLNKAN